MYNVTNETVDITRPIQDNNEKTMSNTVTHLVKKQYHMESIGLSKLLLYEEYWRCLLVHMTRPLESI